MFDITTVCLLIAISIVTALNPSSVSIYLMVLSSIFGKGHSNKRLALYGTAYLFGSFLMLLSASLLTWGVLELVPITPRSYLAIVLAVTLVVIGLIEVKDYFWYGKKFMLTPPKNTTHSIHNLALKMNHAGHYIVLGMYSTLVLLPYICFSILSVAMIASISFPFHATQPMIAFSLLLLVPSIVLLLCLLGGIRMSVLMKWKEDSKAMMRLTTGILLIFMGWVLTLLAGGMIRLG